MPAQTKQEQPRGPDAGTSRSRRTRRKPHGQQQEDHAGHRHRHHHRSDPGVRHDLDGHSAREDTEQAVRTVSLLYLDELAGRRERVVANNLQDKIDVIGTALELMTEDDRSSMEKLQAYQANMKHLFVLEKFAFVDEDGLIYTSLGTLNDIEQYRFDHLALSGPDISIKKLESVDKKVIIALPVRIAFEGKTLVDCFMEIDMKEMLSGVSMTA